MHDGARARELDDRLAGGLALPLQEVAGGRRGATCQSSTTAGASSLVLDFTLIISLSLLFLLTLNISLTLNSQKVRFFGKLATAAGRVPFYTHIDAPLRLILLLYQFGCLNQ